MFLLSIVYIFLKKYLFSRCHYTICSFSFTSLFILLFLKLKFAAEHRLGTCVTLNQVIQGLEERWSMTLHEVLRGHLGAWPLHSLASKLLTYAHSAQVLGTASSGNSSSAGLSTPGVGASDPGLTSGCSELLAVEEDLKYLVDQCADPMLSAEGAEEEEEDSATEVQKSKGAAESCDSSEFDLFVEHA